MNVIDTELKEKIIKKFENLDPGERLDLVKKIGIPDYVWQCIYYENDADKVVQELIEITEYNAPEYLMLFRNLILDDSIVHHT